MLYYSMNSSTIVITKNEEISFRDRPGIPEIHISWQYLALHAVSGK